MLIEENNYIDKRYRTGKYNGNYKGGTIDKAGYRVLTINKKKIFEHRYILEKYLNRKLNRNENVHHKNGNKLDNRIENLEIIEHGKHSAFHILNGDNPKDKMSGRFIKYEQST